jgi:hypothetical protein
MSDFTEQSPLHASSQTSNGSDKATAAHDNSTSKSQVTNIADALEQIRLASVSVCEAVNALRSASTATAKSKLDEGKAKAMNFEAEAASAVAERPLLYLGVAFAAGWIVSRLMKS